MPPGVDPKRTGVSAGFELAAMKLGNGRNVRHAGVIEDVSFRRYREPDKLAITPEARRQLQVPR